LGGLFELELLHHAPAAHALVLDNAPVTVLLAVVLAKPQAQKHDSRQVSAENRCRK
jgi:hypothetical protein